MQQYKFVYKSILCGEKEYYIDLETRPIIFWTATTDMKSCFGVFYQWINDSTAIVDTRKGQFSGKVYGNIKLGQLAYVSEHLSIDGNIDYIITAKQIIKDDNNFINYGSKNHYLRIDMFNGDCKEIRV